MVEYDVKLLVQQTNQPSGGFRGGGGRTNQPELKLFYEVIIFFRNFDLAFTA